MDGMTGSDDQTPPSTLAHTDAIEAVRELIAMMSRGGISELDLSTGDVTIRLRGASAATETVAVQQSSVQRMLSLEMDDDDQYDGEVVTSPMIGTFYSAPAPGEPPFVQVGDKIEVGQVIGIIEAMKIMNEIVSDHSGTVTAIMVENAQPVEYGFPLMTVSRADALG
jgi:acetyl-CoA carboxylase biotin carboxyl carrier protein